MPQKYKAMCENVIFDSGLFVRFWTESIYAIVRPNRPRDIEYNYTVPGKW